LCFILEGIESIQIGSKLKAITLNNNNESGTIQINTTNSKDCCLNESEYLSLANISLEVHKYYGNPRDIEWGIKNKQIYLFQSRPITNLDNSWTEWEIIHDLDSGQQSEKEYLSRANLRGVFPGASSHICFSWLINTWNCNSFVSYR
jgi:phosphoenolpyruvate synthase/pyruvate phosphate dikinase